MSNRVRTILIVMVTSVWCANFLAPIFVRDFKPPEGVQVAFMAVVGVLTAGYKKEESPPTKKPRKKVEQ